MISITPESLRANIRVSELLNWPFDFNVAGRSGVLNAIKIKGGGFVPIASEGAGGEFLLSASGNLLYVSSEGQAGVIAASLIEGLQLMVAFPYWANLLHLSGGGNIAQMRRAVPYLEKDLLAGEPEIDNYRSFLKSELSLPKASDPIASLHYAVEVLSANVQFDLPDGDQFESLFGTFTIDDTLDLESEG